MNLNQIPATTEINEAVAAGLKPLKTSAPLRLSEWAEEHFYLSAESSYAEGKWIAYPYQRAIMDCISNDDIREVDWKKASRTGYTKIILAAIGYFSQHRRRNQAVWQPTDDDAIEFVKTELDPMLRDCEIMADIFPAYLRRHRDNTLKQKLFLGSTVHIRGGKAAKNYRRLTVDVAILDELDGFDLDIEKEGSPDMLSAKRLEGATFPKHIMGSTPKMKHFSMIEDREESAAMRVSYRIPCPHCGEVHPLTWGGADCNHGFKWVDDDPNSVRHLCFACGTLYTQADYLREWGRGRWISREGEWIDNEGRFRNSAGDEIATPVSIAFTGLWTAYSPQASWVGIVDDWIKARKKARAGDDSAQKTFTNTTLGETWEEEVERTDANELKGRAESFPLRTVPLGGLVLVAGVDVQDSRFEVVVWAVGRGEEMWTVDYTVLQADPGDEREWEKIDVFLLTRFPHVSGQSLGIDAAAIDTGGHYTHQAYNFCRLRTRRKIYAIKGDRNQSSPIKGRARNQDVNWNGKILKAGVKLWHVGVHAAKNLLHGRLKITDPGPGRLHFSEELPPDFYAQLTAESRVLQTTSAGEQYRWKKPTGARNEVLDCTVYTLFAIQMLDLHRYTARMWDRLEEVVQPRNGDLFAAPPDISSTPHRPSVDHPRPESPPPAMPVRRRQSYVESWRP